MSKATCRRSCLAILTMLCFSSLAVGDAISSSRRTSQDSGYPEVIIEPDSPGVLGNGQVFYPEGCPLGQCDVPYCDGAIASSCGSDYGGGYGCQSCDCCPCWTVRAGAVVLKRDTVGAVPIVTGVPNSISTANLGFDYESGPLVSVIRHGIFQSCWDFEATYFGIDDFGSTLATPDINVLHTVPPVAVGGVIPARTDYFSDLDSAEFNFRRQWNHWLTGLIGFRYIDIDEVLATNIANGAALHRVDVDNTLYGLQLGLDAYLWQCRRFSLEAFGKVGIYTNDADSQTTTVGLGGVPVVLASDDDAAFVGDLGLTGVYNISNRWALRGGYQLLWIDGVALAPEQMDNVNLVAGTGTIDTSSTVFYHGLNLAAEFRW